MQPVTPRRTSGRRRLWRASSSPQAIALHPARGDAALLELPTQLGHQRLVGYPNGHFVRTVAATQLCKQSLLAGHLSLPAGASGLPIRPAEVIRWQSPASRWRLRSAQGAAYWDREAEGTLVLTNERLLFAPAQGNLWQHSLKKLRAATLQRLPDTSALITEFHDMQKPIAFAPQNMRLDVNLDAKTSAVTLTIEDLAQMVQAFR